MDGSVDGMEWIAPASDCIAIQGQRHTCVRMERRMEEREKGESARAGEREREGLLTHTHIWRVHVRCAAAAAARFYGGFATV